MQSKSEKLMKREIKRNKFGQWEKGYNGGHTGSEKSLYTPELLEEWAIDLFKWVNKNVEDRKEFLLGDWCFESGYPLNRFERDMPICPLLKEAHEYAKNWQAHMICKGALFKKLDPGFAKFMMACVHGWRDSNQEEIKKEVLANDFAKFNKNMEELKKQLPPSESLNND